VKISPKVSELVWRDGRQNPPRRVRVVFEKTDDETVYVRLEGETAEEEEKE
jgi:ribosomal protein L31E